MIIDCEVCDSCGRVRQADDGTWVPAFQSGGDGPVQTCPACDGTGIEGSTDEPEPGPRLSADAHRAVNKPGVQMTQGQVEVLRAALSDARKWVAAHAHTAKLPDGTVNAVTLYRIDAALALLRS